MRQKRPSAAPEQSKLFIEKAREIGADVDDADEEIMRRLSGQERPPSKQTKSKAKKAAK